MHRRLFLFFLIVYDSDNRRLQQSWPPTRILWPYLLVTSSTLFHPQALSQFTPLTMPSSPSFKLVSAQTYLTPGLDALIYSLLTLTKLLPTSTTSVPKSTKNALTRTPLFQWPTPPGLFNHIYTIWQQEFICLCVAGTNRKQLLLGL